MRKLDLDKYRKMLFGERDRIRRELRDIEQDISYADTGSGHTELADYDNHPADSGTDMFEKEKDLAVRDSLRDVLGRIDEAIGRIERGGYGECGRCGRQIMKERLDAIPYAIYCIECQDIIEGR